MDGVQEQQNVEGSESLPQQKTDELPATSAMEPSGSSDAAQERQASTTNPPVEEDQPADSDKANEVTSMNSDSLLAEPTSASVVQSAGPSDVATGAQSETHPAEQASQIDAKGAIQHSVDAESVPFEHTSVPTASNEDAPVKVEGYADEGKVGASEENTSSQLGGTVNASPVAQTQNGANSHAEATKTLESEPPVPVTSTEGAQLQPSAPLPAHNDPKKEARDTEQTVCTVDVDMVDVKPHTQGREGVTEVQSDVIAPPLETGNDNNPADPKLDGAAAAEEKKSAEVLESADVAKAQESTTATKKAAPPPPPLPMTTTAAAVEQGSVASASVAKPAPSRASAQRIEHTNSPTTKPTVQRSSTERSRHTQSIERGGRTQSIGRGRTEEARARRETEDMRLMWLSLPSHDHPSYYSDTDEDASSSSSTADANVPRSTAGRAPFLAGRSIDLSRLKYKEDEWLPTNVDYDNEEDIDDDGDDDYESYDVSRQIFLHEKAYRIGNRGNKLQKRARWMRMGKLGTASEAKSEKDIHERFTDRLKALQRSQVDMMLRNAGGPSLSKKEPDMLDGCDRLLLRDINVPPLVEESSTLLAPQLLRPILSARALLQSHTLRHTFRNPHIGALSRTALDLRESEGQLSRALSKCLGAMERQYAPKQMINGATGSASLTAPQSNGRPDKQNDKIDVQGIGVEGTHATLDELNPAFGQLDRLFVTKDGLPIPMGGVEGEDEQPPFNDPSADGSGAQRTTSQAVLSAVQQRDVIRAALECLHELGADSLEYVERLDEVRSRLAAVKQKRLQVWNALRIWALKREGDDIDAIDVAEEATARQGGGGTTEAAAVAAVKTTGGSNSRKRHRVAA